MQYDCEIENCMGKTNEFLCEEHNWQANNENMQVIICEECLKILRMQRRKTKLEPRYIKLVQELLEI